MHWDMTAASPVRILAPVIPTALLLSACAGDDGGGARASVRDSAGITIVENHALPQVDTTAWMIDPLPAVSIGLTEGDPAYLFQRVRKAATLSDGRIVVADGSGELRYFDAAGSHLRTAGGDGDGPGEFRFLITFFVLPGDSILAVSGNTRYSLFDPHGGFVRVPRSIASFAYPRARMANGDLLFTTYAQSFPPTTTGAVRDSIVVLTEPMPELAAGTAFAGTPHAGVPASGGTPFVNSDTIVRLPGNDEFRQAQGRGISNDSRPFGRQVEVAADGGDRIAVAVGTDAEVRVYRAGALARIIRFSGAREPLSATEIEDWKEWRRSLARSPDQRRLVDNFIASQEFPEYRPLFATVRYDAEGSLWIARYRFDDNVSSMDGEPRRWYVLDRSGRAIAALDVPAGLTVHEIGSKHILGVTRDELGVERVVLHRLTRGTP
jgi:hypothetical protein